MDALEKILATLKTGELTFIITVLINALQIYLICFYNINDFKDFQWHQQILIPLSIALSYTFVFIVCTLLSYILFLSWTEENRKHLDKYFDSNLIFYYSIAPLSLSFVVQFLIFIYKDNFSFSLEMYCNTICTIITGIIINPFFTLLKSIFNKKVS